MARGADIKPRHDVPATMFDDGTVQDGIMMVPMAWKPLTAVKPDGTPVVVMVPPDVDQYVRDKYPQPETPSRPFETKVNQDPLHPEGWEIPPDVQRQLNGEEDA
jgi:hypothetical protein